MVLPAPRSGCVLEACGDAGPRQMVVHDRTRLTGPLRTFLPPPDEGSAMPRGTARTAEPAGPRRRDELDVQSLVLLAVLLAAAFILNFTVGRAISGISGGLISPEFIISAFCLTILMVRPGPRQALAIGLISAAVIQVTTTSPLIDFVAEGVAAPVMALIVRLGMRGRARRVVPFAGTFVTTVVSGVVFMLVKIAMVGAAAELAAAMLPVVLVAGVFNATIVQALHAPVTRVLARRLGRVAGPVGDPSPEAAGARAPRREVPEGVVASLDDVSFSYAPGEPPALDHVSLDVREGSFLGVVGPSGAGKTTLCAVLSGAVPHHFGGALVGSVAIAGRDTREMSLTDVARTVGSVAQDVDAQMVASVVEDELLFGLENFGVPRDEVEGRLEAALAACGISDLRDREIATLSGGQKQKVAIAAMLALRPRMLVLDEPTAALDPASSTAVFETLARLNAEGVTVVVVEQKVALLAAHCDRVCVMSEGRLAFDGTPREVFSHGEELRALGVDSPRVARVSNSLAAAGLAAPGEPCLTVGEAVSLVRGIVGDAARGAGPGPATGAPSPAAGAPSPAAPGAEPAGGPVVSFEGVSFAYPGTGAGVRDLSLEVRSGEVLGVVGANGAGKTTLTKLLCGLLAPDAGVVRVAGLDTREVPVSSLASHVATLFQNPDRQICRDTVLEEVAFGPELAGADPAEARGRAAEVCARFGLPAGRSPFSLSRGQRQMVALASVAVMEPEVVLLDEPTSGLDYRECMTVMGAVADMARRGCAVVMVCHDMEVVSDFAGRLLVMADGRACGRGPLAEVFSDEALMRHAGVEPPQVVALSAALAREVSPAFAGLGQVSEVVRAVEGMVRNG